MKNHDSILISLKQTQRFYFHYTCNWYVSYDYFVQK